MRSWESESALVPRLGRIQIEHPFNLVLADVVIDFYINFSNNFVNLPCSP